MNEKYNFALDKEYLSYEECKKLGYSESACRENDLKKQLKEIRLLEEEIGLPLEFLFTKVIDNSIYCIELDYIDGHYIIDDKVLKIARYYNYEGQLEDWIVETDCGWPLHINEYRKTWWLSKEEAERALEEIKLMEKQLEREK